jgi:succinate dehydrogenase / fumarate reductase cytochrome b subunit
MSWITNFFSSSIGRKVIMSLTGLFLITFLIVHLVGNLQLIAGDQGQAFNQYAYFMTTNPLIKFVSIGLYVMILLHAVLGLVIYLKNKTAKGIKPTARNKADVKWASKNMALLGTLILFFLIIHMGDFWFKMKFTDTIPLVTYDGWEPIKNLYEQVTITFDNPLFVVSYVFSMLVLGFHLWHGFGSGFQTLGLNHSKYNKLIDGIGKLLAVVLPIGYAIIPLYYYFVMR